MITHAELTNPGHRKNNEDFLGHREREGSYLFALADGLGGHGYGEVASQIAVETALDAAGTPLGEMMSRCNQAILKKQQELSVKNDIKTTLCLLEIKNNHARWAHCGDSRVYVFEDGKYLLRTADHSVVQMLYMTGEIKEKEIRFHDDRNRLLRVLGSSDEPKPNVSDETEVKTGLSFLLCSDGFWELIDEKQMEKLLKKAETPREWLNAMEQVVQKNGKGKNMDNYSATAVFVR